MLKKVLKWVGIVVVVLVALAVLLYFFGGMWPPTENARKAYAAEVAAGRQPKIEDRFTIPIPGCVCHSGDLKLQMQHSVRHLNECGGCHGR